MGHTRPTTSNTIDANPGGEGIKRLQKMYEDFFEEQEERFAKGTGAGQMVASADLLLHKVFANPLLRKTEIVTDPIFMAYLERNRVKAREYPQKDKKKKVDEDVPQEPDDPNAALIIMEPTYEYEGQRYGSLQRPEEGFQIGLTLEEHDREKERFLQHTTFLMQQKQVGYEVQTTAMLKRGNDIDK
jgi:hypothetical protein